MIASVLEFHKIAVVCGKFHRECPNKLKYIILRSSSGAFCGHKRSSDSMVSSPNHTYASLVRTSSGVNNDFTEAESDGAGERNCVWYCCGVIQGSPARNFALPLIPISPGHNLWASNVCTP